MRRRPRVLQVGPIPPPIEGGIAAYLDGLMRSELASRYELIPFDMRVPDYARRLRPLRGWASARFVGSFVRTLRATNPDIVHIHSSAYLSFWEKTMLGQLASRQRIPWVLHLHDGYFEPFLANLRKPLSTWARNRMHTASAVITVCDAWRSWLQRWTAETRLSWIPNAIHVEDFPAASVEAPQPRLLFMGDLTRAKGIEDLALGLGNLAAAGLRFELDVVGAAPSSRQQRALQLRFAALGLSRCSHFHGKLHGREKRRILQQAAVFVLPSHRESFCLANLEAMACGLPVVSTRSGAIPEVVRHGQEGLLIEPGDVRSLQQAVATLILDPEKRIALGAAAQRRARQFDWRHIGAQLAALYDSVLGTGSSRQAASASPELTARAAL